MKNLKVTSGLIPLRKNIAPSKYSNAANLEIKLTINNKIILRIADFLFSLAQSTIQRYFCEDLLLILNFFFLIFLILSFF